MEKIKVNYCELSGSSKEIGRAFARHMDSQRMIMPAPPYFTDRDAEEAMALYRKYCPEIVEEMEGFAEEAHAEVKDLAYSWMSYLIPRCSCMAVLGSKMTDGHTKIARNYEFGLDEEDLSVVQIHATGKYAHIGGGAVVFGRTEGINECGLAVSMSSCGIPVSNMPQMKPPKAKGLHFWTVIRILLDDCKDVEEALEVLKEIPIGFNVNLYLADSAGHAVIFETINGHRAFHEIREGGAKPYVFGTNHIVLPELKQYEPVGMRNSMVRYQRLRSFLEAEEKLDETQIKKLLLTRYPDGMSYYAYKEWFGTIKSVVMDTVEKRYSICWLGQEENGWEDYVVGQPIESGQKEKSIKMEKAAKEFFEPVPIEQ